jgi:hypothetical protein
MQALRALHGAQIAHWDLKLENILLVGVSPRRPSALDVKVILTAPCIVIIHTTYTGWRQDACNAPA